jgi:hypothetical protein
MSTAEGKSTSIQHEISVGKWKMSAHLEFQWKSIPQSNQQLGIKSFFAASNITAMSQHKQGELSTSLRGFLFRSLLASK